MIKNTKFRGLIWSYANRISLDYAKYNAKEKIRNSIKDKLSNRIKISSHRSFPNAPRNLGVHYDTRGLKGEEAFSRALISASCQTFRGLSEVEAEARDLFHAGARPIKMQLKDG